MAAYFKLTCLLDQEFVKDTSMTVEQRMQEVVGKIGENIQVRRFVRFKTGEGLEKRSTDLGGEVQELLG
jgi:elongation factor Ts